MLLRANALAKGYSGRARRDGRAARSSASTRGIVPARAEPRLGRRERRPRSARASRAAARRRGRGARSTASCSPGPRRSRAAGLEPVRLAGEGRALARSTGRSSWPRSARSGSSARGGSRKAADIACALSLEALQGSPTSFHPGDPRAAPAAPARRASRRERASRCSRARRSSSRTAGATRCRTRTRSAARRRCTAPAATSSTTSSDTVAVELNAATDNPLVLVEEELIVSNGNFHGQPLAFALDALAIAVAELASISERRTERLVNPSLSDGLPRVPDARDGGLNSGFMIPQYVAASLVSENKVAQPSRRASTRSRRARARRITSRWGTRPA